MPSQNNESQPSPALKLIQMIHGTIVAQLIYVAAKLCIADLLQEGPIDCSELAKAANVQPAALYRVLRALASFGIFTEIENGRFRLTPMAEYMESETEGSLRVWAIYGASGFGGGLTESCCKVSGLAISLSTTFMIRHSLNISDRIQKPPGSSMKRCQTRQPKIHRQ